MTPRPEIPADSAPVRRLLEAAFGRADEADLVERLRTEGDVAAALTVEAEGEVVGHVVLSRLRAPDGMLALGPAAVAEGRRRQGIGAALVRAALDAARAEGARGIVVLGDPGWYARFGFTAEAARRFESPFAGPSLLALRLAPGDPPHDGPLRYARAFDDLSD